MEPKETTGDRLLLELLGGRNSQRTDVHIDLGATGIWVAVTCCLVMLALNVALLAGYITHDRKIERMQDHLNAIYMMAPHLKPEPEKSP